MEKFVSQHFLPEKVYCFVHSVFVFEVPEQQYFPGMSNKISFQVTATF
jgi:hypothetical protein